jgi:hypothetical protein
MADRLFPTVPVADILYHVPPAVHLVLFLLSVLCLLLFTATGNKKVATGLFFWK